MIVVVRALALLRFKFGAGHDDTDSDGDVPGVGACVQPNASAPADSHPKHSSNEDRDAGGSRAPLPGGDIRS